MPIKLNISEKGKAWKIEVDPTILAGKSVGDKIDGKHISHELEGYELEITGGSDFSGFPMSKNVEGLGLKKMMLSKGWGMKESGEGLRKRKTIRGKIISDKTVQLNIKVLKSGKKHLAEIFPDQNKAKEEKVETKSVEAPAA